MRMRPVLLAAVAVIVAASPAIAEPIVITGGGFFAGPTNSSYEPPFGFTFSGEQTVIGGSTFAQAPGLLGLGQTIGLTRWVSVTNRWGPLDETVNGRQFRDVSLQGALRFIGPSLTFSGVSLQAPFTMEGEISLFQRLPRGTGELLFTQAVRGSGTAFIRVTYEFGGVFRLAGTTYAFSPAPIAPVPEPGSLMLLITGLTAAAVRRHTRVSDV